MRRFLASLVLSLSLAACSAPQQSTWPEPQNDKEASAVERAAIIFPDAIAPPPFKYKHPGGSTQLALYQLHEGVFRFPAETNKSPRFAHIRADIPSKASQKQIRKAFQQILNAEGYTSLITTRYRSSRRPLKFLSRGAARSRRLC